MQGRARGSVLHLPPAPIHSRGVSGERIPNLSQLFMDFCVHVGAPLAKPLPCSAQKIKPSQSKTFPTSQPCPEFLPQLFDPKLCSVTPAAQKQFLELAQHVGHANPPFKASLFALITSIKRTSCFPFIWQQINYKSYMVILILSYWRSMGLLPLIPALLTR